MVGYILFIFFLLEQYFKTFNYKISQFFCTYTVLHARHDDKCDNW